MQLEDERSGSVFCPVGHDHPQSSRAEGWFWMMCVFCVQEFVAMAAAESRRGDETDATKRIYPGGAFDPLNFAKGDIETLKLKEIKNGRLAMMACLGFVAQVS